MKLSTFVFILFSLATAALNAQINPLCEGQYLPVVGPFTDSVRQLAPPPPTDPPVNPPDAPDDRLIFWVHGLGGAPNESWVKAANTTQTSGAAGYPARKATSLRLTYSEYDLPNAGADLNNAMLTQGLPIMQHNGIEDPLENFVIAHSQGGMVSRSADLHYANGAIPEADWMFGGIVTFGSAHQGAQIINNKDMFPLFAAQACQDITAGPFEEWSEFELQSNWLVDWIIPDQLITNVKNMLCNFLGAQIVPIAFDDYQSPITEDYKVGGAGIGELNAGPSVIPAAHKVVFYGVEEEPVAFRVMYNLLGKTPNEFPVFEADDDDQLVNEAKQIQDNCFAKYTYWNNIFEYEQNVEIPMLLALCNSMFAPPDCAQKLGLALARLNVSYKLKNAWLISYNWWATANDKYKAVIGAVETQTTLTYKCTCISDPTPGNPSGVTISFVNDPDDCVGNFCVVQPEYDIQTINHPNDGVVLAESAMGYPGADWKDIMPNSNHQQMRNDSNTKAKLLKLFAGEFGEYFITEERQ